MEPNNIWKEMLGVVVLLFFAYVGISNVVKPDIRNFPKGGELLRGWNRFQIRWAAAAFAGFAMYGLYRLVRDIVAR